MPLCVFDKFTRQNQFNSNGLAILRPSNFTTYEQLNGDYSVNIKYPMNDATWLYLTPFNIVRNSENELFVLHTCGVDLNTSGKKVWAAQGRHISYYLADKLVEGCKYDGYDCFYALSALKDHTIISIGAASQDHVEYDFTYSSDITDIRCNIDYDNINPIQALLGASNSIVSLYNGEIYRNNFHISVNHRKQGYKDAAFLIKHGLNMTAIRENISVADMLTVLKCEDNYGNGKTSLYPGIMYSPHQIIKHLKFSYSKESMLEDDLEKYWQSHKDPKISYEVNFKDLRNVPEYSEWMKLQSYAVGDSGRIYSEVLQIDTNQKIIARTLNDLTGEVESVTLGNYMPSLYVNNRYNNMLARNDSPGKRLDALESRMQQSINTDDIADLYN